MRFATAALLVESVLIAAVILYVPYTEIDWRAYMEEVSGFLDGELDYRKLQGGTGPLVYPGGFVWIYSVLYYLTKLGEDIQTAQLIFAGVYLFTLAIVLRLYTRAGLSWSVMLPLFLSRRLRSLYVLRLFNDCWAMLFLFVAVTLIAGGPARNGRRARHWLLGCFFFSFAVSVKMNVLLFAPGMLYVMLRTMPLVKVFGCLVVCALWQVMVGLPFLSHDYAAYLTKGFELNRVFTQRWSVNYQFLENHVFVNPQFGLALLAATVATWVLAWRVRWSKRTFLTSAEAAVLRPAIADVAVRTSLHPLDEEESPEEAEERGAYVATVLTFFESNLIGVAFARTLHYQFYTWFFLTVPFILHYTSYSRLVRLVTFALIRQGFEVYPPTENTSLLLQTGFGFALAGLLLFGDEDPAATAAEQKKKALAAAAAAAAEQKKKALAAAVAAAAARGAPRQVQQQRPQAGVDSLSSSSLSEEEDEGEARHSPAPPPPPQHQQQAGSAPDGAQKPPAKPAAKQASKQPVKGNST